MHAGENLSQIAEEHQEDHDQSMINMKEAGGITPKTQATQPNETAGVFNEEE